VALGHDRSVGRLAEVKRLRFSAHKLRHTSNVISRVAGIDPLTRSKMLTHSDPRAHARYDHLLRSTRRDSASKPRCRGILGSRRMTSYFGVSLLSVLPRSH
jgi:integrase